MLVFFHRSQNTQMALHAAGVVVADIAYNHLDKLLLTGKTPAIVALPFQDAPEPLHRPVVNTVCHTGHTLRHPYLLEFAVKGSAGILEPPVTMEQRMGVWIGFHSLVKGLVDERVIIALAEHIGHDTPIAKVKNGAQIEFMYRNPLVPFEFRHIGQPFLIGLICVKLAVQKILRNVLWILGAPGATLVSILDGGFDIPDSADTQHTLIVHMDAVVVAQVIIEPAVTFIRAFLVDSFYDTSQALILCRPAARFPRNPLVVGGARYLEQSAGRFNGIALFLMTFLDCPVNPPLPYS